MSTTADTLDLENRPRHPDLDLEPFHVKGTNGGTANGIGTLAKYPEKHAKTIEMLAHPWNTIQGIAREVNLDPSTVAGISQHNVETIQANRDALRGKHSLIGRLSADLIIHRLINEPDKVETRDANILYGTSTDKDQAERGIPSQHIQVTHTLAQDIFSPLVDILSGILSAPVMGSSSEPRQLNARTIEAVLVPDPAPKKGNE